MTGHDDRGRFTRGNREASAGGRARAARLPPARRREIARAGWHALVVLRFNGDPAAAGAWLGKLGAFSAERAAYGGTWMYRPDLWPDPGPMPERRAQC